MSWEKQPGYCPACKAVVAPDSKDCLACGCVFEKWNAKQARASMGDFIEQESRAQAQSRPVYDVASPSAGSTSLLKRLSGAGAAAGAAALLVWLYSPGKPSPAPERAQPAGKTGFSFVVPAGWTLAAQDAGCRDGGCVIAVLRLEGPSGRVNPSISLRLIDRGPENMAGQGRASLEAELAASIKGGYDTIESESSVELSVDGLPSFKIEGSGSKRLRLETAPQVAMNAEAYLREQMAKDPGKGVYSVMAQTDHSRRNPNAFVVTQQAQYADIDARKIDGVVLVPLSRKLLRISYEHDQSDSAAADAALGEFLAGLRVNDRSRPVDRLGPLKPPAQIGAIGLIFMAVFLLLT